MNNEDFSDPEWVAEQLKLDWRERQFLTDAEATGEIEEMPSARKGVALAHSGGALSRFASESALKHLQADGRIKSVKVRKIDEKFQPARGWMRLWPLREILKAEMVMALSDVADLPFLRLAELLSKIPSARLDDAGDPIPLVDDLADDWTDFVLFWFGYDTGATAVPDQHPESNEDADRTGDPRLLLIDRKWLFGRNLALPEWCESQEPWLLLAEVGALRSKNYKVEWVFDSYRSDHLPDGEVRHQLFDARETTARTEMARANAKLELNLAEPLRRFAHSNRRK